MPKGKRKYFWVQALVLTLASLPLLLLSVKDRAVEFNNLCYLSQFIFPGHLNANVGILDVNALKRRVLGALTLLSGLWSKVNVLDICFLPETHLQSALNSWALPATGQLSAGQLCRA